MIFIIMDSVNLFDKYVLAIQSKYPKTPIYVIEEFVSRQVLGAPDVVKKIENTYFGDVNPVLRGFSDWLLKGPWSLEVLNLGFEDFDKTTQQAFMERSFGDVNAYLVPMDKERTDYQRGVAKGDGTNEPIILLKDKDGYVLYEGWHRTMAILLLGKNGNTPDDWEKQKIKAYVHL